MLFVVVYLKLSRSDCKSAHSYGENVVQRPVRSVTLYLLHWRITWRCVIYRWWLGREISLSANHIRSSFITRCESFVSFVSNSAFNETFVLQIDFFTYILHKNLQKRQILKKNQYFFCLIWSNSSILTELVPLYSLRTLVVTISDRCTKNWYFLYFTILKFTLARTQDKY